MMRTFILFILFCFALSSNAQQITSVDAAWIKQMKSNKSDTLYVINFWATWCKPCMAELPDIDSITVKYAGEKLKVILVSNDMKKDAETKLAEFVKSKNIQSQVVWMSEMNADNWINLVDKEWSGAIPATWIMKNKMAFDYFKEGEITSQELKLLIDQTIDLK